MLANESQNLLPVLEMAEAAYRRLSGQLPPAGRDGLAQRAARIAAGVSLALTEPRVMRRLRGLTGDLHKATRLDSLLVRVLDGAVSLTEAEFGTLQLRDPVTGSLWLVTQSGFGPAFLDYFAVVDDGDDRSACGRAAKAGAQAVIADVNVDAGFEPHRGIAAAAGFRAVQSTLLDDYAGRPIGVVSTHFARPLLPSARQLRILELYGDAAGEAIARLLGLPAGNEADPVGPAVLAALLGRAAGQSPDPAGVLGPGYDRDDRLEQPPTLPEAMMSGLADTIVHRLFTVGLSLDSARSIVGNSPAGERVAAAADEVDRLIRDIRTIIFSLAAEAGNHSQQRWPPMPEAPGPAYRPAPDGCDRPAQATDRPAQLQQRMEQTARSLQMSAAGIAALLEQQAASSGQPQRIDYQTEIKRWRAFADQAEQIARRWEQAP